MKASWQKRELKLCSRKEKVYAALQYAASFHCLAEQWKDCEELEPKPKEKWISVAKKERGNEEPNRVVCGSRQARKMYRTKIRVTRFGNMVKTTFGRP